MVILATILGSSLLIGIIAFFIVSLAGFIFPALGQILFGVLFIGASLLLGFLKFDAQIYKSKKVTVTLSGLLAMSGLLLLLLNLIGVPLNLFGASVLQPITSTPVGSVFGDITTQIESFGFEPLSFLTLGGIFIAMIALSLGFNSVIDKKGGKRK